jgi:hypothetical protein
MDTTHIDSTHTDTSGASAIPAGVASARHLRMVLRANAATSAAAGAVAAALPHWLDDVLGTGHPGWVRVVGLGLLLIAVEVLMVARADSSHLLSGTRLIVGADTAWVVATIATIAAGWYDTTGAVVMAVAGLGVADFAVAQHVLRRRLL